MSYSILAESLAENLEELKPLLPLHYEELALDQEKVPLDPQYEVYLEREARGELLFVIVRDEEKALVGYYIGFISPGLHYQTCLTCITDIFYLKQDARGGGLGVRLFQFVERELKSRGVDRWFVGSKWHKDASKLFEYLGFGKVETYYSKYLGD
jgi:GNAT superfamily N-acetyltransferase